MASSISPSWNTPAHLLAKDKSNANNTLRTRLQPQAIAINSPLLFKLYKQLAKGYKYNILDIAQANTLSLDFYSYHSCKLFLPASINEFNLLKPDAINTPHKWHRSLVKSMGFYKNDHTNLNIIMIWALPNYLGQEQLKGLIEYLLPQCAKQTYLHMYIYDSENMASKLANYQIGPNDKVLLYPDSEQQKIECPCYTLRQLESLLHPFKLEHSVMLSSGIQEFLFQLD